MDIRRDRFYNNPPSANGRVPVPFTSDQDDVSKQIHTFSYFSYFFILSAPSETFAAGSWIELGSDFTEAGDVMVRS